MAEYVNSLGRFLGMKTLVLLDEDGHPTHGEDDGQQRQGNQKTKEHIANQE